MIWPQQFQSGGNPRSVAIIGGGASGVILAAHLLRDPKSDLHVTVIEKQAMLGRGLAYSTTVPEHVLNVRASNMSAFADDARHFTRWLAQRGIVLEDPEHFFAPRNIYGEYLEHLLSPHLKGRTAYDRLDIIDEECVDVITRPSYVELRLANGTSEIKDICILATGHEARRCRSNSSPALSETKASYPKNAADPVMIAGTGLSMIDTCLALLLRGHRGPILAVSRRGLLPKVHRKTTPVALTLSEIPVGDGLLGLMSWFRGLVRSVEARGGNWRDVVDGMRPHTQTIWRHLPEDSRRQFFRHLKPWWDMHRHRMAPQIHEKILAAIDSGQLQIIAGRILKVDATLNGMSARIQRRRQNVAEEIQVTRIYDCTGVIADPEKSSSRLIQSLLESGTARTDPLQVGLDVSKMGALLDRDGTPNERLYAVGPLTRGTFLEIEAVPDIRVQCQRLAQDLLKPDHHALNSKPAPRPNSSLDLANPIRRWG